MVERWTVNPEALIRYIVVQVHVGEPLFGAVAQLVRAPACHAGGREFKSRSLRHFTGLVQR